MAGTAAPGGDITTTIPEALVANPRHLALTELRRDVVARTDALSSGVDRLCADIGNDQVWTGPVSRRFLAEVTGRKRRLAVLAAAALAEVDAALQQTPVRVTASAARTQNGI